MGGAPAVSIAIVTYNATAYVRRCLESLRALTAVPHEVLVVDNASREETRAYLRTVPWIALTLNDENRLWCPALNQAFKGAHRDSRYFMLLNPDVEVLRADWLERLLAILDAHPRVGITTTARSALSSAPSTATASSSGASCTTTPRSARSTRATRGTDRRTSSPRGRGRKDGATASIHRARGSWCTMGRDRARRRIIPSSTGRSTRAGSWRRPASSRGARAASSPR
jgi:glycosyltransferase involved in cell wall biosynthesis